MTKKLILILLCVLMIVLPACAKDKAPDAGTSSSESGSAEESTTDAEDTTAYNPAHDIQYYPKQVKLPIAFLDDALSETEKNIMAERLQNMQEWPEKSRRRTDVSEACKENVIEAYWDLDRNFEMTERQEIWKQTVQNRQIVIVGEKIFFPDSEGTHKYVFVPYTIGSSEGRISEITGLSVLNGEAELSFVHALAVIHSADYCEALIVLKVKSDFFET